jgi:hypothetical protein
MRRDVASRRWRRRLIRVFHRREEATIWRHLRRARGPPPPNRRWNSSGSDVTGFRDGRAMTVLDQEGRSVRLGIALRH